jgi:predicted S18 family serine protease
MTINVKIELHGSDEYVTNMHFPNMNDMIKEITKELKNWQDWDSMESTLRHFETEEKLIQEMKDSGFYYIKDKGEINASN